MNDDVRPGEPEPPEDAPERSLIGRVLSQRYRVDELIATGGMGAVFRGEHLKMKKRVAIKVLLPEMARQEHLVARFEREAVAGAHVRHPNVAAATDFGQEPDGTHYLVLEYARGVPLADILKRGAMHPGRAARVAAQLAAALGAVHERGIVHRDVKPRNVLIEERPGGDLVKLVDFGLARVEEDRLSILVPPDVDLDNGLFVVPDRVITEEGVVLGTVAYMAPEAANGMDAVDARSDLYALGLIFYEMVAGAYPFEAVQSVDLFAAHRHQTPPRMRERTGVEPPPALEAIVMRLLEKDPAARLPNAAAVIDAIAGALRIMEDGPVSAPQAPPPSGPRSGPGSHGAPPARAVLAAPPSSGRPPIQGGTIPIAIPAPVPAAAPTGKGGTLPLAIASPAAALPAPPAPPPPARNAAGLMRMRDRPPTPSQRVSRAARDAADKVGGGGRLRTVLLVSVALLFLAGGVFALKVVRDTPAPAPEPSAATAAPSAVATASAAPTASAPRELGGKDAAAWREEIKESVTTKDHARGIAALLALAELEPAALDEREIRTAAASALVGAEFARSVYEGMAADAGAPAPGASAQAGGDAGSAIAPAPTGAAVPVDRAWSVVADRLGTTGLDLLFEVARARAGTKAAVRASTLLHSAALGPRVPVDMLVALDLATATCEGKKAHFARAASDGGARTLSELQAMRNAKCGRRQTACCFQNDKALAGALEQLKKRLGK